MARGYLEGGFGTHGEINPDRGDDREFGDNDWRERNLDREDRDRGIFGEDERGWSSEKSERRSGSERYSASTDDHYRSWRDRHLSELDRDYRDYCRERETQFQRDFDDWRRQKYANPQPLSPGMTQSGMSHDPTGMTQAAQDREADTLPELDPTATATLGTNSDRGRSRK